VRASQDDLARSFHSALVALPGLDADGDWQYQISAAAKPETIPPSAPDEYISYKILKLWKGDEGLEERPNNIEVEIFCDGNLVETVILSEENHWSYSWRAKDDGANWTVVERNIPEGYTMTLEERGTDFVLTNALVPDVPDVPDAPDAPESPPAVPPKTGDTSNILLYAVLMFVSGAMLIILGITGNRNRYEKTD
jgi:hypothetical protein